jgi:hypothetical protein
MPREAADERVVEIIAFGCCLDDLCWIGLGPTTHVETKTTVFANHLLVPTAVTGHVQS